MLITWEDKLHDKMTSAYSKSCGYKKFSVHTNTKKYRFKIVQLWRAFSKSSVFVDLFMRISVFGSRIRNNKFPFSNLSGIVWTGPNITSLVVGSKKKSSIGSLPENICYLKSHFNVSIVWKGNTCSEWPALQIGQTCCLEKQCCINSISKWRDWKWRTTVFENVQQPWDCVYSFISE